MIINRAIRVLPRRLCSPSYRCFSRVPSPPLKGLTGEDASFVNKVNYNINSLGGGSCDPGLLALLDHGDSSASGDDTPHGRLCSGAYPGRVSGNIMRYNFNAGNNERYGGVNFYESGLIGSVLLQVFSVRIIDCENSSYLYGTIQFDNEADDVYLYSRQLSDPEVVSRDGTLSLTGPHCCLSIHESFIVLLQLKDKDGYLFSNKIVNFGWSILGGCGMQGDQRMIEHFYGNSVSVAVYYTMFTNALQAKVEVEVIRGDDEDGAGQVYGRVVARYSNYDYSTDEQKKYFQMILFDKSESNYVEVEPGKPIIPLSRYVVAVPTRSYLIIEANLWDYDKFRPNDHIAKGTVVFSPKDGVAMNDIQGVSSLVRVIVTWSECDGIEPW